MSNPVFLTNFFEQKRSLETLLKESHADKTFYFFLSFSAFVGTLGFLMNSAIVIIGSMFVAPLLFPILSLGMGISTSSREAIRRSSRIISKSTILVILISFLTAFILNEREVTDQMLLASRPELLYFLIAFASGIIVSYAWVKEKISSTLPGVAMAVALLPPLALVGISLSFFSRDLFTGSLTLYLLNLLAIVLGSTIIFSLFGFSRLQRLEEEKIEEEKIEEKIQQFARKEGEEERGSQRIAGHSNIERL